MQWVILAAAAAAVSNALPSKRDTTTSQLATFDDLAVNSELPVPYDGLNFLSLTVSSDPSLIVPQSPPNYAGARGDGGFGATIDGTATTSFDLESFYLGCIDGRGQEVLDCQFTVTGIKPEGHDGPILETYSPTLNSDFSAPMQQYTFSGFDGLSSFSVSAVADNATLERLYFYVDNVQYTTYQ